MPLSLFAIGVLACGDLSVAAQQRRGSLWRALDTDNSGTLDLHEALVAAAAVFSRLDHDSDGMLDVEELRGRLTAHELAMWDPDADGTLTKDDYLVAVERRFGAADVDQAGVLTPKELRSAAGQRLLRLLK
jgi:hypothetical protein